MGSIPDAHGASITPTGTVYLDAGSIFRLVVNPRTEIDCLSFGFLVFEFRRCYWDQ
jgi:hypothetical protein